MANTVPKESKVVYLQIGQNYEHLANTKQFDVSEWVEAYPGATIYMLFRRPGEDVVAPVQTMLEDGILTWTISNWETGIIGVGFAEIRAIDSTTGLVKKSHVIPCSVEASVTDEDTAPDFPSWIDRMITMNEHLESVYADFNQELADGIAAIQDEATEQKDDVVAAIQDKGDAVIASIPMSYTDLIEALAGATYNANRHYDHDEFVWYDNHLWRRRTDSPSIVGPWNEDDWVRAALTAHVTEALWQVESMQNELYNSIAPAWDYYDTTASYAVGDYVINRERLYRCISPVSGGGEFDYSKWEVVTVATELQKYVKSDAIAPEYSASTTYKAGQYVWYSGNVYRCKTDISTAEAWTAAHWQLVKIGDELTDLRSAIQANPAQRESTKTGVDLDVSDSQGNVLLRLANGHIQTKEFDSSVVVTDLEDVKGDIEGLSGDLETLSGTVEEKVTEPETAGTSGQVLGLDSNLNPIWVNQTSGNDDTAVKSSTKTGVDLDISDINGNVLVRFENKQIKTAGFDSLKYADVKAFGATGNGSTDDTEALEAAMQYGYENNTPVRFSSGTYKIRRPLTLRSNMEIFGEGNATIKCKASATTRLTAACNEGDETITVASTTGFEVGDPISISYNTTGDAAARHCSVGYITGLTSTTITFVSAYDSIKSGAVRDHEVGCYVSNTCAIFRSWGALYPCDNVHIHNLILDGNRQSGEWADWFAGCIHIDAATGTVEGIPYIYSQSNPTFRDLIINNSHFDGISDQGNGGATAENCKINDPKWHGVHFGTTYSSANVINNTIKGTINGAGVFWCAGAKNIVVEGNRIINCHKGCSDYEYGSAGNKSIINGNIFINTEDVVFDFSLGNEDDQGTLVITDNIIETPNAAIAKFRKRNKVIFSNNIIETIESGISFLFDCTNSSGLTFIGNICPDTESTIISGSPTQLINALNSWN